ncbi:uncharacterized protein LOC101848325 [Aplysia californica]|uniref:Uncharacterized protein LOC101848325 n=1 Tax=Aplysia californica TaxID=6500 RepID=A0ABM0K6B0_APLCA|nr:uncharacterized protein LOC101848325 [Aplysia californica]
MATAMIDSARSFSSVGGCVPPPEMDVVNTETRLGDEVLSPQFVKELEHYYDKAGVQDKAKCLELITSVRLGQELRQQVKASTRPKTAMPALRYSQTSTLSPYQTTYTREYPAKVEEELTAIRPMTSDGYAIQVPPSHHPGPTTYDIEYARKVQRPASPERAGSSSGHRNNRPHPSKSFMVWKFPHKNRYPRSSDGRLSEDLTNQKLNQITKRLCHSVYQNDYLGIPQGFQVRSAFNLPPDWKDNVPYDMDSNQRQSYQTPFQQSELVVPTTRYGSNGKKPIPSVAVIPTANKRLIGVNGRTTYDRHYNDNAGPVVDQIRDVGRKLGAEALSKYYQQSVGQDRDLIGRLLDEYGGAPSAMAPPPAPPSYERPFCPSPHSHSRSGSVANKTPPLSHSRSGSAANKSPPVTQRSNQRAPSGLGGRPQSVTKATPPPSASIRSKASSPAYKPRPALPAATAIMLPPNSPCHVQMPTTPLSVPYTPPIFLS